jgi:hypothetical protein
MRERERERSRREDSQRQEGEGDLGVEGDPRSQRVEGCHRIILEITTSATSTPSNEFFSENYAC